MNTDSSKRLRDRFREETQAAILASAESIFSRNGLHAASMNEIARDAGIAVGTLYNHFKDREAILTALLDARRTELVEQMDRVLEESKDQSFKVQLQAFLAALFQHMQAHWQFFVILVQGEHGSDRHALVSVSKPKATLKEVYFRLETLVKHGVKRKELRPKCADLLPVAMMGMIRAVWVRQIYDGEAKAIDQVDALVDLILSGAAVK